MAETGEKSRVTLRQRLQAAVQSINWTYAVFWRPSPQQGELIWADGYYNGSVKTRKTIIMRERSPEEYGLQRSDQLRELFESLSSSTDATQSSARRPTAALSPEDLTDTEWFYLVCMSCTFDSGTGIPGQAFTKGRPVWLCKANEASTKVFSRALLAKTALIQTVVCIPLAEGVLELGSTNLVREDTSIVQQIVSFFVELSKPTSSEQSISSSQSGENGHEEIQARASKSSQDDLVAKQRTSAFFLWKASEYNSHNIVPSKQQGMLKNILLQVPLMYGKRKQHQETTETRKPAENNGGDAQAKYTSSRKDEDVNTAHAMLERRRREKLNERFIMLRKLVPFVTKMDKASILGDTIEYLKQLQRRVAELEKCNRRLEVVIRGQGIEPQIETSEINNNGKGPITSPGEQHENNFLASGVDMEVEIEPASPDDSITPSASATNKDQVFPGSFDIHVSGETTSLDIQCTSRKGILLDIITTLSHLNLDVSTVHAGSEDRIFRAQMKAEVKSLSTMLRPSEEDIEDALQRTVARPRALTWT